jgi:hypothetical protein
MLGSPRWWFTNRETGALTVAQWPNLALLVWGAAELVSVLLNGHPDASATAGDIAKGALIVWALDEMVRGVNPWRRLLGMIVLAGTVLSLVRS